MTAPEVRPETIWRWKSRTRMTTGMVTMMAAAEIDPVGSSNCELPVKFANGVAELGHRPVHHDARDDPFDGQWRDCEWRSTEFFEPRE